MSLIGIHVLTGIHYLRTLVDNELFSSCNSCFGIGPSHLCIFSHTYVHIEIHIQKTYTHTQNSENSFVLNYDSPMGEIFKLLDFRKLRDCLGWVGCQLQ